MTQIYSSAFVAEGRAMLDNGRIDDAIAYCREALEQNPSAEIYHLLSVALIRKLDFNQALENLTYAIQLDNKSRLYIECICRIVEMLPLNQDLIEYMQRVAGIYHDNPGFLKLLERTALYLEDSKQISADERVKAASDKLHNLGRMYGTDKSEATDVHTYAGMSYMDVYEPYLERLREKPINFLEIGVLGGSSLRTWREYFPQGKIFGLDIDPGAKKHEGDRIKITIGSQSDRDVLANLVSQVDGYDVILDDGSHASEHMQVSFAQLWPAVKPGGLYIIEDLGSTYRGVDMNWPGMKYNSEPELPCNRKEFENFFLQMISDLDNERGDVLSVHFWHFVMIVMKKRKSAVFPH